MRKIEPFISDLIFVICHKRNDEKPGKLTVFSLLLSLSLFSFIDCLNSLLSPSL